MATARSEELRALAQRVADAFPRSVVEVVLTGSVSRGMFNRVWEPTTKRLAARVETLAVKPDRLAERIEEALTEPDPRRRS